MTLELCTGGVQSAAAAVLAAAAVQPVETRPGTTRAPPSVGLAAVRSGGVAGSPAASCPSTPASARATLSTPCLKPRFYRVIASNITCTVLPLQTCSVDSWAGQASAIQNLHHTALPGSNLARAHCPDGELRADLCVLCP